MQRCLELNSPGYLFPSYCIVQFAKSPASAQVKTRLSSVLNAEQRIQLHCSMTRYVCETATGASLCPVRLWISGEMDHPFLADLSRQLAVPCHPQAGQDLGARMQNAAGQILEHFTAVVFIGSDCPFIDAAYLHQAMLKLADNEAVIGPATDGGYVLLGLRKLSPTLFEDMPWGTETVLSETQKRLVQLGWSCALLAPLADIDRPEDLSMLAEQKLAESLRKFSGYHLPA